MILFLLILIDFSAYFLMICLKWKGRKTMTNRDSLLKSRDITMPRKVCLVKAMVFSVVMYGCERWTIKKAACQRIDAFELWCWRRILRLLDCKEIQYARPPCPSQTPEVYPNPCPLSQWCHPTILSSVTLFSLKSSIMKMT